MTTDAEVEAAAKALKEEVRASGYNANEWDESDFRDLVRAALEAAEKVRDDLLRRYIDHVGESEGTTFLSSRWLSGTTKFTDAEIAKLRELETHPA